MSQPEPSVLSLPPTPPDSLRLNLILSVSLFEAQPFHRFFFFFLPTAAICTPQMTEYN